MLYFAFHPNAEFPRDCPRFKIPRFPEGASSFAFHRSQSNQPRPLIILRENSTINLSQNKWLKITSGMEVAPRLGAEGAWTVAGMPIYIFTVISLEHQGNRLYGFMGLYSKKLDGCVIGWYPLDGCDYKNTYGVYKNPSHLDQQLRGLNIIRHVKIFK